MINIKKYVNANSHNKKGDSLFLVRGFMRVWRALPNKYYGYSNIKRTYDVLEINFSDFSEDYAYEIYNEAEKLFRNTNPKAANTGFDRDNNIKWIDTLSGVIAEYAVLMFLLDKELFDNSSASRPIATDGINQIDFEWKYLNKKYSIEVRSSFANNGLAFALFAVNKISKKSYFDVIGPYYNMAYKKTMRVKKIYLWELFSFFKR